MQEICQSYSLLFSIFYSFYFILLDVHPLRSSLFLMFIIQRICLSHHRYDLPVGYTIHRFS